MVLSVATDLILPKHCVRTRLLMKKHQTFNIPPFSWTIAHRTCEMQPFVSKIAKDRGNVKYVKRVWWPPPPKSARNRRNVKCVKCSGGNSAKNDQTFNIFNISLVSSRLCEKRTFNISPVSLGCHFSRGDFLGIFRFFWFWSPSLQTCNEFGGAILRHPCLWYVYFCLPSGLSAQSLVLSACEA